MIKQVLNSVKRWFVYSRDTIPQDFNMALWLLRTNEDWVEFFTNPGIPAAAGATYEASFVTQRITEVSLPHLVRKF